MGKTWLLKLFRAEHLQLIEAKSQPTALERPDFLPLC
jgi:hypothetical protein